jgi:hypothetical protein
LKDSTEAFYLNALKVSTGKEKPMAKKKDDDLLTISQAARLRGVTPQSIDGLLARGRLEAVEVAGIRLLRRADVLNYKPAKGGRPKVGTGGVGKAPRA